MENITYWCDNGMGGGEYRADIDGTEVSGPIIDRLAMFEHKGVVPPCKPGDKVYVLCHKWDAIGDSAPTCDYSKCNLFVPFAKNVNGCEITIGRKPRV